MHRLWRIWMLPFLAAAVASGCRTVPTESPVDDPLPGPRTIPTPSLRVGEPHPIEPDYDSIPRFDPTTAPLPQRSAAVKLLTESECWQAAIVFPPPQDPFETGLTAVWWNEVPTDEYTASAQQLLHEARARIDATARNTAAGMALDDYFRLADAEGRAKLLVDAITILDRLRKQTEEVRVNGVPVPVAPEELDRQRAGLLTFLEQAELGANLLNISLKRKIGVSGQTPERLWPSETFAVTEDSIDVATEVQSALANRPDLQLLRLLYIRLNPETLPAVEELLRGRKNEDAGHAYESKAMRTAMKSVFGRHHRAKAAEIDAVARVQVVVLRQRLADLIAARERQVADEVRSAVALMKSQARQVGLARWKAENRIQQHAKSANAGPLAESAAELEAVRARADVIEAVMTWHQARARFETARGSYAQLPAQP